MIRSRRITLASTTGLLVFSLTAYAGPAMPAGVDNTKPAAAGSVAANDDATADTAPERVLVPASDAQGLTEAVETIVEAPAATPPMSAEAGSTDDAEVARQADPTPDAEPLREIVEDALAASETDSQTDEAAAPGGAAAPTAEISSSAQPADRASPVSETDPTADAPATGTADANDTIQAAESEALTEAVEDIVSPASPAAEPGERPGSEVATDTAPGSDDGPVVETAEETAQETGGEPAMQAAEAVPTPAPGEISAALEAAVADRTGISKSSAPALAAFYSSRDFAPLWIDSGKLGGAARAVVHRLKAADTYGLDPARYRTPSVDIGLTGQASPAELAAAEIALTEAAIRFARDAQTGTFDPAALGESMTARPVRPETEDILDGLAAASDRVVYLEGFNPPHPQFRALQELLAGLRTRTAGDVPPQIGDGQSLKPGMTDDRVPVLRARLGVPAPAAGEAAARTYDDATVDAVKAFQEKASLDVDGVIGPQTRAALNGGAQVMIADVLVNMERWRWMPRDMGEFHVWVNVPEYWLRVVSDGEPMFETRVIVGKAENQTPIFSDEIEYVDVNPFWNVPRSIAVKEMLPSIRQDPGFLNRQGLQVLYSTGGREYLVDPYAVDWGQFHEDNFPFRFRQPPGNGNALGRVKFMFPNKHAVYLHDTPTRNLFAKSVRAFSHGCVRVDKPVEFADALLSREEAINGQRIKKLIGGGANGELPMKRHVPVHLTYFTVWVDSAGETQKRPDIYGHDERMKSAMGLGT